MEASPLESKSSRSKKIMLSSEDVFNCMGLHGGMFQGSDEVEKPLLYDSGRAIHFALTCLYSAVYL